ncbi:hypothetical protein SY83_13710 [Paenibacillus swuensis]|uniref:Uncharacterized protein n=1 Tax=Paenibacillus swuensis TaxID=1178515 RepID=A0A172TJQ4_9BACL|nr:hypothetical protein SY83_13710 [Paenibacillus swuensis]
MPDANLFSKEFFDHVSTYFSQLALSHRYYDSIDIQNVADKDDQLSVIISASIGIHKSSTAFGLNKDNNVWKMNIYPIIENKKKKIEE